MGSANRSLEWLARRRDGEVMALIAWRDNVSPQMVKRATAAYGPFPTPSRHLGRTITASPVLDERTQRCVDARRRGERVTAIARREGVAHQLVSRYTAEAGPFPSEAVVHQWVPAREGGQSIAAIAARCAAPRGLVGQATRPWAVSPRRGRAYRRAWSAGKGISRMAGVSDATGLRWVRTGRVPDPDFVVGNGHPLWLTTTIARWLEAGDLADLSALRGAARESEPAPAGGPPRSSGRHGVAGRW